MGDGILLEEELKLQVADRWFKRFAVPEILGRIDFAIADRRQKGRYYLWAEAKRGVREDIYASLVQLVLTIGKARTFDRILPPAFLGAFDEEKIAFLPFHKIMEVFSESDVNWNVTPSDHSSDTFKKMYARIADVLKDEVVIFNFQQEADSIHEFIKHNFVESNIDAIKIEIDKNNFVYIYQSWLREVKPSLNVHDWTALNRYGIVDADFYLADLFSENNMTLKDALHVVLQTKVYFVNKGIDPETALVSRNEVGFSDGQAAHASFWRKYRRPPREVFWSYILDRRDLLVPQDIRERKGSFFTPRQWVELAQKSIAVALGEDWQDDWWIWDCAAGTGNLLAGLANPSRIFASTLDKADVDIMKDIARNRGLPLLEGNVFQFDFLNDDLDGPKTPQALKDILGDPERRAKLIVYINPPYAEAANARTKKGSGENRKGIAVHRTAERYAGMLGPARNELFAQFLCRIQEEVKPGAIGDFSTLKILQAPNFEKFRSGFEYSLTSLFVVPANTFDNVKGDFPIGFFIWKREREKQWKDFSIEAEVYDKNAVNIKNINIHCFDGKQLLMDWHRKFYDKDPKQTTLAWIRMLGSDVQNNNGVYITMFPTDNDIKQKKISRITPGNLYQVAVYFAVRKIVAQTWLNDREQYLAPSADSDGELWRRDAEFRADCLVYTLLNVRDTNDPETGNHWLPFSETEVGAKTSFRSGFMARYLAGKVKLKESSLLADLDRMEVPGERMTFSPEAQAALDAGRDIWKLYHEKACGLPGYDVNASLLDAGAFFKGRDKSGRINAKSADPEYNAVAGAMSAALKALARKIEPKIYEYGFMLHAGIEE